MDLSKFITTRGRTTPRMSETDDECSLYMRGATDYMDMIVWHKIINGHWPITCKSTPDLGLGLLGNWRYHKGKCPG